MDHSVVAVVGKVDRPAIGLEEEAVVDPDHTVTSFAAEMDRQHQPVAAEANNLEENVPRGTAAVAFAAAFAVAFAVAFAAAFVATFAADSVAVADFVAEIAVAAHVAVRDMLAGLDILVVHRHLVRYNLFDHIEADTLYLENNLVGHVVVVAAASVAAAIVAAVDVVAVD